MRVLIGIILNLFAAAALHGGNHVAVRAAAGEEVTLNPWQADYVREYLIHIFDSAQFHHQEGGGFPVRSQKKIRKKLIEVTAKTHFEVTLEHPCHIVVEGRTFAMTKMWAGIRESDGFVFNWIFEQPAGTRVDLNKANGQLIVQFAPFVLDLLGK